MNLICNMILKVDDPATLFLRARCMFVFFLRCLFLCMQDVANGTVLPSALPANRCPFLDIACQIKCLGKTTTVCGKQVNDGNSSFTWYTCDVDYLDLFIFFKGYDMEDAMILNKASFERGFAHGTVLKCEVSGAEFGSFWFSNNSLLNNLSFSRCEVKNS